MTIQANLADGRVLNFPDGTEPAVIQSTVKKMIGAKKQPVQKPEPSQIEQDPFQRQAQEPGFFETGAISTGRGLARIGRALGIVDPETEAERKAFEALGKERPVTTAIGEAVGESLPFAAVPIGAIAGTGARVAATAGLGALEGGLISKGGGGTESEQLISAGAGGTIAGSLEAALPHMLRLGSRLVRKFLGKAPKTTLLRPDGSPTAELADALDSAGVEFEDLQEAAMDLIAQQPPGAVPEQAARAARFEELGIPTSKGVITKGSPGSFKQLADEQLLLGSTSEKLADPFRGLKLRESEAVKGNLEQLVARAGVPQNVGAAIKEANSGREVFLKNQKNALYKTAIENSENAGDIPFPVGGINNALPADRTIKRIARREGNQVDAVMDLLAEFGVDQSDSAAQRLTDKGIGIDQLSLRNFEDFRQELLALERADKTGASSVIIGPVREALDIEADNIVSIMERAGIEDTVLKPFKEAREIVRTLKTEFSPQAITGRLTGTRADKFTPIVKASQIFKEIVGTNKPIELLESTVDSLKKAGPKGIQAMGDLQAATIFDLIEHGFKAETRQIDGIKTFGPVAFKNRLKQIGDDKLELIFSTNPDLLRDLNKLKAIADDLTIPADATPKGSAFVNVGLLQKSGLLALTSKLPLVGKSVAEALLQFAEGAGTRGAVETALDVSPDQKRVISVIESELPSVAVAFGLMAAKPEKEETQ